MKSTEISVPERVYIETFGCQMNSNDSDRVLSILTSSCNGPGGYVKTGDPFSADLILLNTCSVRDKAEQKVYSLLGRFKPVKIERPSVIIAVLGCVAQQQGLKLLKRIPYLDMVVGTQNLHRIRELLIAVKNGSERVVAVEESLTIGEDEYTVPTKVDGPKAFVPIMRGCDNFCAYCIVPYTRGREVSRAAVDIIAEIKELASRGVKEVTLIGQNVNSYAPPATGGVKLNENFSALLKEVVAVDGVNRVRFVTSHPKDTSEELIALFGTERKIATSLHLPVQSGSNRLLKLMGRGYTVKEYLGKIDLLKEVKPGIALSSDIIVGFPGETDEDFSSTMALIERVRYDNLFSFKYSPRPGTRAALFDSQVDPAVASKRLQILQKRQRQISAEKSEALKGRYLEVLVEGASKGDKNELTGRTACNKVVNFPGSGSGFNVVPGDMIELLITDVYPNSLRGVYNERGLLCS